MASDRLPKPDLRLSAALRACGGGRLSGVVLASIARTAAQILAHHLPADEIPAAIAAFHQRVDTECQALGAAPVPCQPAEIA